MSYELKLGWGGPTGGNLGGLWGTFQGTYYNFGPGLI